MHVATPHKGNVWLPKRVVLGVGLLLGRFMRQVAVGNVKLEESGGGWDVCFSVVVNNMVRGAYGAALLMAEYYDHLKSHPAALAALTPAQAATNSASPSLRGGPPTRVHWYTFPACHILRLRLHALRQRPHALRLHPMP